MDKIMQKLVVRFRARLLTSHNKCEFTKGANADERSFGIVRGWTTAYIWLG